MLRSKKWRIAVGFVAFALVATAAYAAYNFYDPVGTHDLASCSTIAGWARDADTTEPILVAIYKGAPYPSGTFIQHVWADKYRSDLPFADKYHGFSISTPAAFKTGYWERVYIHAINADTDGNPLWYANNPLLNLTGKYVYCSP